MPDQAKWRKKDKPLFLSTCKTEMEESNVSYVLSTCYMKPIMYWKKNIAAVQQASGTHLPFLIVSWHPRMEINLSKSQHHFSHDFHNVGIFVGRMMLVI